MLHVSFQQKGVNLEVDDLGTGYSQRPTKLRAEFNPLEKLQKQRVYICY